MPPKKRVAPAQRFSQLRARAQHASKDTPTIEDFVLGPDDGFDPEIRVSLPLSLKAQESYYYAARAGDTFAQVRAVLGDAQYTRIVEIFDAEKDSADLFVGFARMLTDHLSGKGAGDVEGGSGAS
ncbi:hypothetical protein [Nocardia australiensis]|uniref:hypothetical protein n=1 Tax=Nocardia australiensis TaxID=2887191 RepID=UPI001D13947F|nr:hypothetical protein [Nocardia australiensis]